MGASRRLAVLAAGLVLSLIVTGCNANLADPSKQNLNNSAAAANAQMGRVNIAISDSSTCGSPAGPFAHVFVTVVDVLVHESATAELGDPGWHDLAPQLRANPKQIDLLNAATTQCLLANLGAGHLTAGHYQQIRIILAQTVMPGTGSGDTLFQTGQCPSNGNCVVLKDGTVQALQLSSEAITGIKIAGGQFAGGEFVVQPGQTVDLNLQFDACASIVQQPGGGFLLKPTIRAFEVQPTTSCPPA